MGVCISCAKMAARAGGQGQWAVVHLAGHMGPRCWHKEQQYFLSISAST